MSGYNFSEQSYGNLQSCDIRLQKIFQEIIKVYDISILCGYRSKEDQESAFDTGHSKLLYPDSKHNAIPSRAIDVTPYPVDWNDEDRFYYLAGLVLATVGQLGIKIRWGGDWKGNFDFQNNKFNDLTHYELAED